MADFQCTHPPVFGNVSQRQIYKSFSAASSLGNGPGLDDFSKLHVQALDGVGRIDHPF
jgi:hypothetical protein